MNGGKGSLRKMPESAKCNVVYWQWPQMLRFAINARNVLEKCTIPINSKKKLIGKRLPKNNFEKDRSFNEDFAIIGYLQFPVH